MSIILLTVLMLAVISREKCRLGNVHWQACTWLDMRSRHRRPTEYVVRRPPMISCMLTNGSAEVRKPRRR